MNDKRKFPYSVFYTFLTDTPSEVGSLNLF